MPEPRPEPDNRDAADTVRRMSARHTELRRSTDPASQQAKTHFRGSRYFAVGHQWYAQTREGRDIGPFGSRRDAELTLARFLAHRVPQHAVNAEAERRSTQSAAGTRLDVLVRQFLIIRQQVAQRSANSVYAWARMRLEAIEEAPSEHEHAELQADALRHLLSSLDREHQASR